MKRPVALFTDFGTGGPYVGQIKSVLLTEAPEAPIIDLVADAPAFNPRASAYLLAALAPYLPGNAVMLAVVDPGVGGARDPLVVEIDGRLAVGPDNGLFEPLLRRAAKARAWRIDWRPDRLSSSFHGRDLFAPIAGRLARGIEPEAAGCVPVAPPRRLDWPDDLGEVVYIDHYGNAMTGLRVAGLPDETVLVVAGQRLRRGRTFGSVPPGAAFWYENSIGLAEVAINQGRADTVLGLSIGSTVEISS